MENPFLLRSFYRKARLRRDGREKMEVR